MKLGNASWGFRETPLQKQLAATSQMGMRYLELGIAGHENDFLQLGAEDQTIDKTKLLFAQHKIELLCASTGCDFSSGDEAECKQQVGNVKGVIDIAQKLGIRYLRIFAGFSPVEDVKGERWDLMISSLNEVLEYAANTDVLPAIETHGGVKDDKDGICHFASVSTPQDVFSKLMSELKHSFGIVFDPANLGAVGMSEDEILEFYNSVKEKISYFHIKDFARTPQGALVPSACGEGQLNWTKLWPVFSEFAGIGVIEYEIPDDIVEGSKRSLDYLDSICVAN